jgi:hypothetical protein
LLERIIAVNAAIINSAGANRKSCDDGTGTFIVARNGRVLNRHASDTAFLPKYHTADDFVAG